MQSVCTCAGLDEDEGHAALSERLQQQALEVRRTLLLALASLPFPNCDEPDACLRSPCRLLR